MGNEPLRDELGTLERKVKLMISEHEKLKSELSMFRNENSSLKSKISQQSEQLSGFQNSMKISKLVDNMVEGENNSSELKEVLNNYIKEIDKCITQLSEA
ncbi:MAG: hypothetical protein JXQ90_20465 [Cyclobacteriaceae bacterium]